MSTASSPSGSGDLPEVDLRLPEELRSELRQPFGELVSGEELLTLLDACGGLISVGDVVTHDLLDSGIVPWIAIYDGRTERADREDLQDLIEDMPGHRMEVSNPAAQITRQMVYAVRESLEREEPTRILVRGKEDLAALVCVALAPIETCVVYGAPGKGVVLVKVDQKSINIARSLISKMEESH
jgi:hypothetical protein